MEINTETDLQNKSQNLSDSESIAEKPVKKAKPGIVYLSSVPYGMSIPALKNYFSNFGEIGNVFFQMANRENFVGGLSRSSQPTKKFRKVGRLIKGRIRYSEGWVEFLSKRNAKWAAEMLNNSIVGGKKKSPYYDCLWSVKYIGKGFKWAQLRRRIEHEKEIHKRKMTNEIRIVTEETDQYTRAAEIAERLEKRREKHGAQDAGSSGLSSSADVGIKQRLTEQQIQQKQQEKKLKNEKYKAKLQKSKNKKQQQKMVKREERREAIKSLGAFQ
uniref:Activator of basal transcription 1 n=2 Tax=Hirondellea gigas TaxID=1518452 RepID=A0A2P2HZ11_9CRUS